MQKGCLIAVVLVVVVVLGLGGCGVAKYNGIVENEQAATAALTKIDSEYKRRLDLVPQLVEIVKGAADFEQQTITAVTDARASAGRMKLPEDAGKNPEAVQQYFEAQQAFGSALQRFALTVEAYPVLRATDSYRDFQSQYEGTENRINVARRDYIDAVKRYNVSIRRFPGNLVASTFGFGPLEQLRIEDENLTEVPKIDFSEEK